MGHKQIKQNIISLNELLMSKWIENWSGAYNDELNGGYHERLDSNLDPMDLGYKRALTQCRQIYIYSNAVINGYDNGLKDKLRSDFDFLRSNYFVEETGGTRFSVTPEGKPQNDTYDLYAHAFVIMSMSLYYKATGDERAIDYADKTLDFIDVNFRALNGLGFLEALGSDLNPENRIRRQNSHMHLLEASLFMYEISNNNRYIEMADEIISLFKNKFFDNKTDILFEFFNDDLSPHDQDGLIIEPGHHHEWVWLLDKYVNLRPEIIEEISPYIKKLYNWANEHGYDKKYGGIYNSLDNKGNVLDSKKRIWPITEALKSTIVAYKYGLESEEIISSRIDILRSLFDVYIADDGFWVEIMEENMTPFSDYRPGTTPYHISMSISESLTLIDGI